MNSKLFSLSLFSYLILTVCSFAETKDCVDCFRKTIGAEVQPDKKSVVELRNAVVAPVEMASKGPLVIAKPTGRAPAVESGKISQKDGFQLRFCMQFEQAQDTVDVETMIEDMENSPYASDITEFWTTSACHAPSKNDVNVPIIYNTASNPVKNELFPKVVHDYFLNDKKDMQSWLRAINSTTSDGYTFLDFIQYNILRGNYSLKKTSDAAQRIVTYLCKNGGVYSKYKDSAKCP